MTSQLGAVGAGLRVGVGRQVEGQAAPLLQQALNLAAHALVHRSDHLHHVLHALASGPAEGVVKHHLVWTHRRRIFRPTDGETDRQTDRNKRAGSQPERHTERQTCRQEDRKELSNTTSSGHTDGRHSDKQTDRQADRQTDRQRIS